MSAWLLHHFDAIRLTLSRLLRTPFASLFNIVVIGVALALPLALYLTLQNLQRVSRDVQADPQVSVFMALEASGAEVKEVESRLKNHPGVARVRFVSRDAALQDIKRSTGVSEVLESLSGNPLPDAFVVDARSPSALSLERLRDEFARWPRVAHVQVDSVWAQRLEAVVRLGRLGVLMLGTVLAFALVAITFNTIRLQILTQQEEIEVAQLIGATAPFIRRPFLYYGTVLGLAGAGVACGLVWGAARLLNGALGELSRLYGTDFLLATLPSVDMASIAIFAGALGWVGAWLSVSRHILVLQRDV